MGAKRKVDAKLYNKITRELKTPKDDKKVMEKYHLGQTLVRAIRNSYDYNDFVRKTSRVKSYANRATTRKQMTKADKAVVLFYWICIFGFIFMVYAFIRWLIGLVFGA